MITHLCMEFLAAGQIPYYDLPEPLGWYLLSEDCRWEQRGLTASQRMLISNNIDTQLETVEPQLREWTRTLDEATAGADGTLFFPVQCCAPLPGDDGTLLVAGMAFIPHREMAVALDGADPVALILQACREIRFGEVLPANLATDYHPVLQEAWRGATWPANERRQMPGVDFQERRSHHEAEARSKTLLYELLTGDQLCEMEAVGQFHVEGADGYTYLIRKGHGHNVWRIEGGQRTVEYCIITRGWVPVYDLMLTQKLLLETDPEHFLRTANSREMTGERRRIRSRMEDFVGELLNPEHQSVALPRRPVPGSG